MALENQTSVKLNNGIEMPQFGMGVYMVPEGPETVNAVAEALRLGYRHIDTAHAYQNERSVGKAVADSGIPRDEIWITTKLWPSEYGRGKTAAAIDKMLARLGTDHIDLLLLHQQFGDYMGAWADMEDAVDAGKVRLPLSARPPREGDRFRPFGMQRGTRLLSDFFTDLKLDVEQKRREVVVTMQNENGDEVIVAILGRRIDDRFKITSATRTVAAISLLPPRE